MAARASLPRSANESGVGASLPRQAPRSPFARSYPRSDPPEPNAISRVPLHNIAQGFDQIVRRDGRAIAAAEQHRRQAKHREHFRGGLSALQLKTRGYEGAARQMRTQLVQTLHEHFLHRPMVVTACDAETQEIAGRRRRRHSRAVAEAMPTHEVEGLVPFKFIRRKQVVVGLRIPNAASPACARGADRAATNLRRQKARTIP